jgi:chemotaxis signal transduction protein
MQITRDHEADAENPICLFFKVGRERCGILLPEVQKVTELGHLNRLARLPPPILGISHHHGRVITVMSLAQLMGFKDSGGDKTQREPESLDRHGARLVILAREPRNIALLADHLLGTGPFVSLEKNASFSRGMSLGQYGSEVAQRINIDWIFERIESLRPRSPFGGD